MKREMVVQTINELTEMKLIVKIRRKAKDNRRVYVDNHYQLIFYVKGKFKGKKQCGCTWNTTAQTAWVSRHSFIIIIAQNLSIVKYFQGYFF